ncbi:threonine/homoserine/homoserine lactone efflux protein [Paenibacillus forsythiae]|uniref:Threonine/homoserine/homoserine lactone efflux protein n=1 Tax=Paenibacillus forsythiae TaxID=365616 RepID=A0ABU3H7A8_9BACL|nr:LysE family transporter [Paenibacillus forsythiae]MDT3426715.1 threonine/homoserine/homoserine lactone efflux protein [Paenibacillus forsythiae]
MIFRGLQWGLLLQLAVGPVCFFIFHAASLRGFGAAEAGVAGVTLADGLFILAALRGAALLGRSRKPGGGRRPGGILYLLGAGTLMVFGLNMIAGMLGHSLLPALPIADDSGRGGMFVRALLLTASNPLTLLFWTGIFSAKMAELRLPSGELMQFGLGCLLATVLFLTAVAVLGDLARPLVTPASARGLNFLTGILFLYFAFRLIVKWIFRRGAPTA